MVPLVTHAASTTEKSSEPRRVAGLVLAHMDSSTEKHGKEGAAKSGRD